MSAMAPVVFSLAALMALHALCRAVNAIVAVMLELRVHRRELRPSVLYRYDVVEIVVQHRANALIPEMRSGNRGRSGQRPKSHRPKPKAPPAIGVAA